MKKVCLLLLILCLSQMVTAQTADRSLIGRYYWKRNVYMTACNLDGSITNMGTARPAMITTGNQLFSVIDVKTIDNTDYAIVQILNYDQARQVKDFYDYNFTGSEADYDAYIKTYPHTNNYGIYQRYFRVREAELAQVAVPYTYIGGALAGGVINFPFKLRLQKEANDFSSAFNLGAAFGYTFPHYSFRNFTYSFLFAAAIANVNLDASSVSKNAEMLTSANDFSALTFAIGGLVQYDRFQAGIFLGIDRLGKLNNDTFGWRYQNKPWISIGFGYSIFSVEKEAVSTSAQQP